MALVKQMDATLIGLQQLRGYIGGGCRRSGLEEQSMLPRSSREMLPHAGFVVEDANGVLGADALSGTVFDFIIRQSRTAVAHIIDALR